MSLESLIPIIIAATSASGITGYFFSKKLEKYKEIQLRKQKAALIAEFFAKWIKYSPKGTSHLSDDELFDYYEDLNQMSLQLSLWIEDEQLIKELMGLLNWKDNAKDIRTLTGIVREYILETKNKDFDPQEIVLWSKK